MKRLIIGFFALAVSFSAFSQIKAGTIRLSLNFGNSPYTDYISAPNQYSNNQTINVAKTDFINNGNSFVNMIGVEGRYFLSEGLAIKLLGGGQHCKTPARLEKVGTGSGSFLDPQSEVPTYTSVPEVTMDQSMVMIGFDKYYTRNNISIYAGLEGGYRYGSIQSKDVTASSGGASTQEVYGFIGAITLGSEYNAPSGLFIGLEVRPVSYNYSVTTIKPMAHSSFQASSSTIGFFAFPMLKFGFNF